MAATEETKEINGRPFSRDTRWTQFWTPAWNDGGSEFPEVICGCGNDLFQVKFGNYECVARCSKCGISQVVYDGQTNPSCQTLNMSKKQKDMLPLGAKVPIYGTIEMIGCLRGERYYWLINKHGVVSMMPDFIIEPETHSSNL